MKESISFAEYIDESFKRIRKHIFSPQTLEDATTDFVTTYRELVILPIVYIMLLPFLVNYFGLVEFKQVIAEFLSLKLWTISFYTGCIASFFHLIFPQNKQIIRLCLFTIRITCSSGALIIGYVIGYHFVYSLDPNLNSSADFYYLYIVSGIYIVINYLLWYIGYCIKTKPIDTRFIIEADWQYRTLASSGILFFVALIHTLQNLNIPMLIVYVILFILILAITSMFKQDRGSKPDLKVHKKIEK